MQKFLLEAAASPWDGSATNNIRPHEKRFRGAFPGISMRTASFLLILLVGTPVMADEFSDYNKDIMGEARAKVTNIYDAWGNNMVYNIQRGVKEGIVVDGPMDTPEIQADGLGNIVIKEGANVGTVINRPDASNTTIFIQKKSKY